MPNVSAQQLMDIAKGLLIAAGALVGVPVRANTVNVWLVLSWSARIVLTSPQAASEAAPAKAAASARNRARRRREFGAKSRVM